MANAVTDIDVFVGPNDVNPNPWSNDPLAMMDKGANPFGADEYDAAMQLAINATIEKHLREREQERGHRRLYKSAPTCNSCGEKRKLVRVDGVPGFKCPNCNAHWSNCHLRNCNSCELTTYSGGSFKAGTYYDPKGGMLCEGDWECGTNHNLNNCNWGWWDIYLIIEYREEEFECAKGTVYSGSGTTCSTCPAGTYVLFVLSAHLTRLSLYYPSPF